MESPNDFSAPLWREETLDIGDKEYQYTEEKHDFYHIIYKKMDTATERSGYVKSQRAQKTPDKIFQPFHSKYLILYKIPHIPVFLV